MRVSSKRSHIPRCVKLNMLSKSPPGSICTIVTISLLKFVSQTCGCSSLRTGCEDGRWLCVAIGEWTDADEMKPVEMTDERHVVAQRAHREPLRGWPVGIARLDWCRARIRRCTALRRRPVGSDSNLTTRPRAVEARMDLEVPQPGEVPDESGSARLVLLEVAGVRARDREATQVEGFVLCRAIGFAIPRLCRPAGTHRRARGEDRGRSTAARPAWARRSGRARTGTSRRAARTAAPRRRAPRRRPSDPRSGFADTCFRTAPPRSVERPGPAGGRRTA